MNNFFKTLRESKWASRKFLMAASTLLLIVLNEMFGFNVDPETYWTLIGIASAYIFGESIIDAARENSNKTNEEIDTDVEVIVENPDQSPDVVVEPAKDFEIG